MTATNLNKFRLARCLLYTIFPQDTYSLPVYIPQMPVYVVGQEVFLADRTLCPLSSCPRSEEDRDPGRARQSVLCTRVLWSRSKPGQDKEL